MIRRVRGMLVEARINESWYIGGGYIWHIKI